MFGISRKDVGTSIIGIIFWSVWGIAAVLAVVKTHEAYNSVAGDTEFVEGHVLTEEGADRYYHLCSIASSLQLLSGHYRSLIEVVTDEGVRRKFATRIENAEKDVEVIVTGYNESMQKFDPTDAKRHDVSYQLHVHGVNDCTYQDQTMDRRVIFEYSRNEFYNKS